MASDFSSKLALTCKTVHVEDLASGFATRSTSPTFRYQKQLAEGTGVNQADLVYSWKGNAAAAGGEDWDLKSTGTGDHDMGALEGDADFAKIKRIMVANLADPDTDPTHIIEVEKGAANGFDAPWGTGTLEVAPGGCLVMDNPLGWTVDATHKTLNVEAQAGTPEFELIIIGDET